jgi:hypothetical protein
VECLSQKMTAHSGGKYGPDNDQSNEKGTRGCVHCYLE